MALPRSSFSQKNQRAPTCMSPKPFRLDDDMRVPSSISICMSFQTQGRVTTRFRLVTGVYEAVSSNDHWFRMSRVPGSSPPAFWWRYCPSSSRPNWPAGPATCPTPTSGSPHPQTEQASAGEAASPVQAAVASRTARAERARRFMDVGPPDRDYPRGRTFRPRSACGKLTHVS